MQYQYSDNAVTITDAAGNCGCVTTVSNVIDGTTYPIQYSYNLDGSLKVQHYPSGAVVTYTPDSAGRMLSAVDSGNSINYVTGATYGPDSALTGFVSGNTGSFAGITNSFKESFPEGTKVRVADRAFLEQFMREWKYHHKLRPDQLPYADREAMVQAVAFYHGGDPIYARRRPRSLA